MTDVDTGAALLEQPLGLAALAALRPRLERSILHHSVRVVALAAAEADATGLELDPRDLLIAGLFHDSGTIPDRSPERFEVVGADRAVVFAREHGRPEASRRAIWDAVALHTSPGIAERHAPLTRALRIGVLADFGHAEHARRHASLARSLEARYPREGVARALAGAVVLAARRTPGKAPASSWPADLVRGAAAVADPAAADNPCF